MAMEEKEARTPLLLETAENPTSAGLCNRARKRPFLSVIIVCAVSVVLIGIVYRAVSYSVTSEKHLKTPETDNLKTGFHTGNKDWSTVAKSQATCDRNPFILTQAPADIEPLKLYESLKFPKNILEVKEELEPTTVSFVDSRTGRLKWSMEDKLKIFLVPHSHNDAGWGMSFEEYYVKRTEDILNNMLRFMSEDREMKLIWAEISFFSLWWSSLPHKSKLQVKKLVEDGQLEFVGGGWVMPDEATVHYYSYLTQLIEGHQWLHHHVNYTPTNAWTMDPFGLSASSQYLLRKAGMRHNVFSRTHYIVKKWFRKTRNLEFYWRQQWARDNSLDMLCYMMPYASYDTSDTCGPGHRVDICRSFREWGNEWNRTDVIENRSLALLDQYRKKSMEFQTNNLLVPIGGDFEWQTQWEWTGAVKNLRTAIDYFNSNLELFAEMKIATLNEYFEAVDAEIERKKFTPKVFSGDFFTYSDAGMDYWSGYFTSRMFHKVTERHLLSTLRAAQILYTLMTGELAKTEYHSAPFVGDLLAKLVSSRRTLSLFQHHDGITGTSTDFVVLNYASKLFKATMDCQSVIQKCIHVLQKLSSILSPTKKIPKILPRSEFYIPVLTKNQSTSLWQKTLVIPNFLINPDYHVAVFNPLECARTELIQLNVSYHLMKVFDMNGNELESEIHPDLDHLYTRLKTKQNHTKPRREQTDAPSQSDYYDSVLPSQSDYDDPFSPHPDRHFILCFVATFKPLEVKHFKIVHASHFAKKTNVTIKLRGRNLHVPDILEQRFKVDVTNYTGSFYKQNLKSFQISNERMTVNFTRKGAVSAVKVHGKWHPLNISFHHYGTKASGLYSFIPSGPAKPVNDIDVTIAIVEGRLWSYVDVVYSTVRHRVAIYNHDGLASHALEIQNRVDVSKERNYELIMRLDTSINSRDVYYTDSNGFQMMKRKRFAKLPIQGHYYPVAASAFIEDTHTRLTILSGQPCGGASLKSGQFELMLDRITMQDDNHGIGQGGSDNLPVDTSFRILFEDIVNQHSRHKSVPQLSLQSQLQLHELLNPPQAYIKVNRSITADYRAKGSQSLPCDVHLVGMFPLPKLIDGNRSEDDTNRSMEAIPADTGLIVHRIGYDDRFSGQHLEKHCKCSEMGKFRAGDVLGNLVDHVVPSSISFVRDDRKSMVESSVGVELKVMELHAFRTNFSYPHQRLEPVVVQLNQI